MTSTQTDMALEQHQLSLSAAEDRDRLWTHSPDAPPFRHRPHGIMPHRITRQRRYCWQLATPNPDRCILTITLSNVHKIQRSATKGVPAGWDIKHALDEMCLLVLQAQLLLRNTVSVGPYCVSVRIEKALGKQCSAKGLRPEVAMFERQLYNVSQCREDGFAH